MFQPRQSAKKRKIINITQGGANEGGFKKGYMSFVTDSRMPHDALADLTNATLDQDNLPRPRESLVLFGEQPLGTVIGADSFIKIVSGRPEKWDISMQVIGGVGKVHTRKDGNTWVAIDSADNSYDDEAIVNFCQSTNRVYISNGVNEMSYYDIVNDTIVKYTTLEAPSKPTATPTTVGTKLSYYYKVTANNTIGESAASPAADTVVVDYARDKWVDNSKVCTITWSAVTGASSYNIYVGTEPGYEFYLTTVSNGLTYTDDGTGNVNSLRLQPGIFNSTQGPKLTYMWNTDGRLYGVGDTDNPELLWYDGGTTTTVGNFSAFANGGYVGVNAGGDTVPQAVRSFRTGKGDAAVTVLSSGVAGIGKMHHIVFTSFSFDTGVSYDMPNVQEATGQGGTVAARAVLDANNALWYPTGQDFKSTGTSPNVQNILTTNSVANDIVPDVRRLNLSAMYKACGLVFENKLYWSLPVGSDEVNQIWIKDLSRRGIWIMPWTITAKFMWLSENNVTGDVNFCIYNGTNILTFSRSVMTQDNGVAFRTRVAHEGLVWSDSGMTMGAIQTMRFKLLRPSGTIQINAFGLDEDGATNTLSQNAFTQSSSFTGWGQLLWSDGATPSVYSGDVGPVDFVSTQVHVTSLEIDETLNQLGWEITTDQIGCDYYLSSVHTEGIEISKSYFGD